MNLLNRLTYRPEFIAPVRALGLRRIMRRWYYHWARPADGILRVQVAGIEAQFYVHSPEELRVLESAGDAGRERQILGLLISALHAGDVVYDIGANVGLYSILLAEALGTKGQVIAFEPTPLSFERLGNNLKLNGITNVRAFRVALADYSGEGKLYYSSEDLALSNLIRPRTDQMTHQMVGVVGGDDFREAQSLPVPRAVKIDVEGYEYAVIRGLRRLLSDPACKLLLCEVHPTLLPSQVRPEQVHELLKSLGFTRLDIHRPSTSPDYHLMAFKA